MFFSTKSFEKKLQCNHFKTKGPGFSLVFAIWVTWPFSINFYRFLWQNLSISFFLKKQCRVEIIWQFLPRYKSSSYDLFLACYLISFSLNFRNDQNETFSTLDRETKYPRLTLRTSSKAMLWRFPTEECEKSQNCLTALL